jgi:hypothetical protein
MGEMNREAQALQGKRLLIHAPRNVKKFLILHSVGADRIHPGITNPVACPSRPPAEPTPFASSRCGVRTVTCMRHEELRRGAQVCESWSTKDSQVLFTRTGLISRLCQLAGIMGPALLLGPIHAHEAVEAFMRPVVFFQNRLNS